ncbi:MAG: deoxyribonuclease V [Gammaproteobacteria bacterium]|nr:deoxyribonuclease V [Gammaproteobacteria bacterium]
MRDLTQLNPAPPSLAEARRMQDAMCKMVNLAGDVDAAVRTVAGVDVGMVDKKTMRGAIVVLSFPQLTVTDCATAVRAADFPYVPGFLSFRELPVLLDALAKLQAKPDLVLCDGQGIAHPRCFGIACHFGVVTGIPAIGVAKSRLIGRFREPGSEKGAATALMHNNRRIGSVLRTRDGKKPLFVSSGHRVSHRAAVNFTLACCTKYRLPETTRAAHRLAASG